MRRQMKFKRVPALGLSLLTMLCSQLSATAQTGVTQVLPAAGQVAPTAGLNAMDCLFATRAADTNITEITLGNIARQKATNPTLQSMADMLVRDHTQAQMQLAQLAQAKGISLPTMPGASNQAILAQAQRLTGRAFDAFIAGVNVEGHENALRLAEAEATMGADPQLRAMARQMLPSLRAHAVGSYRLAQRLGLPQMATRPTNPPM